MSEITKTNEYENNFYENEFFQKHYIRIREDNVIIQGFSDAFEQPKTQKNPKKPKHQEDVEQGDGECNEQYNEQHNKQYNDILINNKGSYQFRLIIDGKETHENPWDLIRNEQGVPLLKWDNASKKVIKRTEEEMQEEMQIQEDIKSQVQAQQAQLQAQEKIQTNTASIANTSKSDRALKYEVGIDEQLEEYTERLEHLEKVIDILVKNAPQKTKAQIIELEKIAEKAEIANVTNGEQYE